MMPHWEVRLCHGGKQQRRKERKKKRGERRQGDRREGARGEETNADCFSNYISVELFVFLMNCFPAPVQSGWDSISLNACSLFPQPPLRPQERSVYPTLKLTQSMGYSGELLGYSGELLGYSGELLGYSGELLGYSSE